MGMTDLPTTSASILENNINVLAQNTKMLGQMLSELEEITNKILPTDTPNEGSGMVENEKESSQFIFLEEYAMLTGKLESNLERFRTLLNRLNNL